MPSSTRWLDAAVRTAAARQDAIPGDWDWGLDDFRRRQDIPLELFPGPSGGRWFEYFFNRVPFRSILPDTERYPSFSQFAPAAVVDDDGPRTPSMSRERVERDLPRIVAAAGELLAGSVRYERRCGTTSPTCGRQG